MRTYCSYLVLFLGLHWCFRHPNPEEGRTGSIHETGVGLGTGAFCFSKANFLQLSVSIQEDGTLVSSKQDIIAHVAAARITAAN